MITAGVLGLLTVIVYQAHQLATTRTHNQTLRAEIAAYERDDRLDAGARARRRTPRHQATMQQLTAPPIDLAAWNAEVDGLPWGSANNWTRPIQVRTEIDDRGALVARIVPERPSTAMIRRITEGTA